MVLPIIKTILYYFWMTGAFIFLIFLSPINLVYHYLNIKQLNLFCKGPNTPENHKKKVIQIQKQIHEWNENGRPGLLCTSRPSWSKFTFRDINKNQNDFNQIDVDLGEIVSIDEEKSILTVEPRMKMGTLTHKLLPLGWTIPIVPEFEELTVGGLICGAGLETSSHKYGYFYNQCLSYEVVLANGEIVNCSKSENPDLFDAIPMSYGTLGFLTSVQIPIIPAKKYVKVQYYPATNSKNAIKLLQNSTHEFIEGLQFGPKKFVIMYGDFCDSAPWTQTQRFLNGWNQYFHWDAEQFFGKSPGSVQYIPTRDYYHRHTNGYFWIFSLTFPFLKYWFFRLIFGWALPINLSLMKLADSFFTCGKSVSGGITTWSFDFFNFFLQDYVIPMDKVPEFLDTIHQDLKISPIWLCPCRVPPSRGMIRPIKNQETMYVDVGIYGFPSRPSENLKEIWEKYEKYTLTNSGLIGFYTDSYLSRDEFNQMFPNDLYLEARKKYGCDGAFPLVYDKVSLAARTQTKNNFKEFEATNEKLLEFNV